MLLVDLAALERVVDVMKNKLDEAAQERSRRLMEASEVVCNAWLRTRFDGRLHEGSTRSSAQTTYFVVTRCDHVFRLILANRVV